MNKKLLCNAITCALFVSSLYVSSASAEGSITNNTNPKNTDTVKSAELSDVFVIGYSENSIDETLPNVDTVQMSDLRDPSVIDIRSALNKNPLVDVGAGAVYDRQQILIRGLGSNYTQMTIDGEPTTEFVVFGPYVFGGKNVVETDTLKQIDIIKGRVSPKQRGGALAGTVNMQTYNPSDFVNKEKDTYFSIKTGYTTKDNGWSNTLTGAFAEGNFSALAMYTHRRFDETENMGTDQEKTAPYKQNNTQNNLLLKGEYAITDKGALRVTGEHFKREQNVDKVLPTSSYVYQIPVTRDRISFDLDLQDIWGLDSIQGKAYLSHYSQGKGKTPDSNNIKQDRVGMKFDARKTFGTNVEHDIMFGAGVHTYNIDWLVKGRTGDFRYIPKTRYQDFDIYAQDRISFDNGLSITPGVRVEYKKFNAVVDSAYQNNPALAGQQGYIPHGDYTAILPNLRFSFAANEKTTIFASYAKGKKSADSSNIASFDHGFGYILPNPDLKDEESDNYEVGVSYIDSDMLSLKANAFYSKYKNMISYEMNGRTPSGKMIMMPKNVESVKVYGVELEGSIALNDNWTARAAASWMKGQVGANESHGVALNSVSPTTAIVGIDYRQDNKWGASANLKIVGKAAKTEDKNGNQRKGRYRTPGYTVLDVTAWAKPMKGMTISGGVYNVFDEKYSLSADSNGQKEQRIDRFTQPGRNFGVSLKYEF